MAISIDCNTSEVISLAEFIDYVEDHVKIRDVESVIAVAPKLKALANNRMLVVERLNEQIKLLARHKPVPAAQVIFLGQGPDFYVRANIWPSSADVAGGRVFQDQFSYNLAHDHNYGFLTAHYFGPGYLTDVYEYDPWTLQGYVGEKVDLRFLGRTKFGPGSVMYYRASRDVHVQFPPDDLSITLNLMVSTPEVQTTDQFFFDLDAGEVVAYPPELDSSRRIAMLRMAGLIGNVDTRQLMTDVASSHPCRRTRLQAYEQLAALAPAEVAGIWEAATKDREPLVKETARRKLAGLAS